jgi:hypothetical protein
MIRATWLNKNEAELSKKGEAKGLHNGTYIHVHVSKN